MLFRELKFREYYHQYFILEADDLTERCRDVIEVGEQDCYALCSSFIDETGALSVNVLAVGSSPEKCRRGLRRKAMLGIFAYEEVLNLPVQTVSPDLMMVKKNAAWIKDREAYAGDDLEQVRADSRIDSIRNRVYPDIVKVGVLAGRYIREYNMRTLQFSGPFLEGRLIVVGRKRDRLKNDELVRALPYVYSEGLRLLAVFTGNELSEDDRRAYTELMHQGSMGGFGFGSSHLKS